MNQSDIDRIRAHVERAVRISRDHVATGGIPFSGIVVQNDRVLGTGFNRVREEDDATAHAEVVALRNAASKAGLSDVVGSTLIASGEPCAMCYMVALHFGVEHIVFAADRVIAGTYGFDYGSGYRLFAADPTQWRLRVTHLPIDGSEIPFQEYLGARKARIR
ncbi:nucleoside deaminase [Nocardia acidivorans]|uniref:nucleoside deaminase n=1 Tax=Nocardia acidivorans TaxID=404580 RepID=UPI000834CBA5|nr:nucleoside deaminase [Nocardia acidivorans]